MSSQQPTPMPDDDLPRVAETAVVRHAPRFGAFIRAGVLIGAIVGVLAAALTPASEGSPRTAVIALTALGLAVVGALIGGGLAVLVDRRSQRRADRRVEPRPGGDPRP